MCNDYVSYNDLRPFNDPKVVNMLKQVHIYKLASCETTWFCLLVVVNLNKLCVIFFPAAGLQDGLRLQAPHCQGEAEAQERRGDSCHCHGIYV